MTDQDKVLIVDDDPIYRQMIAQMFTQIGPCTVIEAGNGKQASKAIDLHGGDLKIIISDLFMPDMDGIEFIQFLHQCKFPGKLTLMSGADIAMLDLARTFAIQSGLNLVGAFPKETMSPALVKAILAY